MARGKAIAAMAAQVVQADGAARRASWRRWTELARDRWSDFLPVAVASA